MISAISNPATAFGNPAALRHRPRRRHRAVPGFRAFRLGGAGRRRCIVMPLLLGMNRGRYYLLTGQTLDAKKAHEFSLVAEVLAPDKVLARAWEIAADLAKKPTLALRCTRLLLTEMLRRQVRDLRGYGLGMGFRLALGEKPEGPAAALPP